MKMHPVGCRLVTLGMTAAVAVVGCTQRPSEHQATASCRQIVRGTRQLELRRIVAKSPFSPTFSWPAVLRSHNPAAAQAVARAFCALPPLRRGVALSLPGGAVRYYITFSGLHGWLATVGFEPPPAENGISGLPGKQVRLYTPHSAMWILLGRAVGLPHATVATFEGKRRRLPQG